LKQKLCKGALMKHVFEAELAIVMPLLIHLHEEDVTN
jgi:hypothetical protein